MMKNQIDITEAGASGAQDKTPDDDSWDALAGRIQKLVMRRSRSLLTEYDDDIFDRGARALRTLMSAAQISERMKKDEAKELETHDSAAPPQITDDAIRGLKRKLERQIERIEEEDRVAEGRGDEGISPGALRQGLGR
ncbi:hypothetical protein ACFOOP_19105 [Marinicaulis aureus]|uniref:Terminase small subunit n=1 Tax=Hyphococcus aureus TaxID=2666033 RepID=A0ABW1KV63_9PROT